MAHHLTAFIQEVPVVEISGGVAIVRHRGEPERAMPVRTLSRFVERCQKALRRHAAGDENIIIDD
jgi:hypothetical protein